VGADLEFLRNGQQRGKGFRFSASKAGFEKLLTRATEDFEGPVNFVFEPTGLSWVPLSAYLSGTEHRKFMVTKKEQPGSVWAPHPERIGCPGCRGLRGDDHGSVHAQEVSGRRARLKAPPS